MQHDLKVALEAARAGAAVVRAGFDTVTSVRMKGEVDPVTAIDLAAEEAIMGVIAQMCPGDPTLGEESGGSGWDAPRVWIVDPLDGTVNFLHSIPHVSVSVAVWEEARPVAGVVIDVMRNEEFTAAAGQGAWFNSKPMRVSDEADLGNAMVATGFGYDRRVKAAELASRMGRVLAQVQGIRRLGSAALDLAWVAKGRYDAYWEDGLAPWDAAAGTLLVTEAGGLVTDMSGSSHALDSPTVIATNGKVHDSLRRIVEED